MPTFSAANTVAGPDLIVQDIVLDPADPTAGESFDITAIIANQGDEMSGTGNVALFIESSTSTTPYNLGSYFIPFLLDDTISLKQGGLSLSVGTYTIRAVVDTNLNVAESDEGNNTFELTLTVVAPATPSPAPTRTPAPTMMPTSTPTVTYTPTPTPLGDMPDLIVQDVVLDPAVPTAGESFNIKAIIANQGDAMSGEGTTKMFIESSTYTTLYETSNLIPFPLDSTGSFEKSDLSLSAGMYTVRVVTDANGDVAESNEDNNTFELVFTVVASATPSPAPTIPPEDKSDLIVQDVVLDPAVPIAGSPFRITAIIVNQGNGVSGTGAVEIIVDSSTLYAFTSHLPFALDSTFNVEREDLVLSTGIYTIRVIVDVNQAVDELDETNNSFELTVNVVDAAESPDTNGNAQGIDVVDEIAYIADFDDGLVIMDVSGAADSTLLSQLPIVGNATGIDVLGSIAYITVAENDLLIVDVTDPTSPMLLGSIPTNGTPLDVQVIDGIAYIADSSGGLTLVDVNDATAPTVINSIATGNGALAVQIIGQVAYVINNDELVTVDISNPTSPTQLGSVTIAENPSSRQTTGLHIVEGVAYIAAGENGLVTVDVTDPAVLVLLGSASTPGYANDVHVDREIAYIATLENGLVAVRVTDPADPFFLSPASTVGHASNIQIVDDVVYVTSSEVDRLYLFENNYFSTTPSNPLHVTTTLIHSTHSIGRELSLYMLVGAAVFIVATFGLKRHLAKSIM